MKPFPSGTPSAPIWLQSGQSEWFSGMRSGRLWSKALHRYEGETNSGYGYSANEASGEACLLEDSYLDDNHAGPYVCEQLVAPVEPSLLPPHRIQNRPPCGAMPNRGTGLAGVAGGVPINRRTTAGSRAREALISGIPVVEALEGDGGGSHCLAWRPRNGLLEGLCEQTPRNATPGYFARE